MNPNIPVQFVSATRERVRRTPLLWALVFALGASACGLAAHLGWWHSGVWVAAALWLNAYSPYVSPLSSRLGGSDFSIFMGLFFGGVSYFLLARKSVPEAEKASEIARLTRDAIDQTRRLARGLSPVALRADGMMAALQELAGHVGRLFHVSCKFVCRTQVLFSDNTVASHLYRIDLDTAGNQVVLSIKDNGRGLPKRPRRHDGMGLALMQYRAGVIGAELTVRSKPGKGTLVSCALPAGAAARPDAHEPISGIGERTRRVG